MTTEKRFVIASSPEQAVSRATHSTYSTASEELARRERLMPGQAVYEAEVVITGRVIKRHGEGR